jgi:flagellar biosynthetic protein FliR
MNVTELQFQAWLASFYWPFLRVGAMVMAAPVFNSTQAPMRWRMLLAVVLTLAIAPVLPPAPIIDPFSLLAVFTVIQQILIGVAMGVMVQMVFAAMVFGGQIIAHKMGLGFAQMVDPQNGVQVPVLSQYYLILSTLLFLLLNGHLILIDVLAQSFRSLPIGEGLSRADFYAIVAWGSQIFAGGLLISLPAVTALLLINLGFGVVTRAAPQLHIFAIGFPLAIVVGFGLMWITLPSVLDGFSDLLDSAFDLIKAFLLIRN